MAKNKIVTLRMEGDFHQSLRVKLAKDRATFQKKMTELLEGYLQEPDLPFVSEDAQAPKEGAK